MPMFQLLKIKMLREQGIRNRSADLRAAQEKLAVQREQAQEELAESRKQWRAALGETKEFEARAFSRYLTQLMNYHEKDARITGQLAEMRTKAQQVEQEQEQMWLALRDNLRGQEKFSYLARELNSCGKF